MPHENLLTQYVVLSGMEVPGVFASGYAKPEEWLFEALGGAKSESGISVSADKALTFAPWYQGIGIISGDVARVPLDTYSRSDNDDRNKERDHPAYELLNRRANRYMSSFTVRETVQQDALSWGNGFAAIVRQGATPVELIPLEASRTENVKADDGRIVFVFRLDDGTPKFYGPDDVLHIRGLGNGLMGYSVFRYARESLGLGLAGQRHGSRHFANDARPNVVLKYPARLDKPDADELLDMWDRRHRDNPSRPALAAGGLDVVPLSVSNQDSQWIESRKFSRDEVASWLSLPPHKLGSDARLSYNSVEAEERAYVSQTLMRWFKRWESECDIKLLTAKEQKRWWYFEHNTGALIQGDFTTQATVAVNLKNAMIITRNEARKKFNLNSVPDGDVFENAATSSGSSQKDANNTQATTEATTHSENAEQLAAVHRELIADRMAQVVRSECNQVSRALKGAKPHESIDAIYREIGGKISSALEYPLRVYRLVTGVAVEAEEVAGWYVEESKSRIRDVVQDQSSRRSTAKLALSIEKLIADWPETRPSEVLDMIPQPEGV